MSAKAAEAPPATEAAKPKGKSKLLLIAVAVLVLAGGGGGAWYFLMGKKAHEAGQAEVAAAPPKPAAPTYMAMENMVVNLADDGERFAQIGITLDLESDKVADQVKTFMPLIRSKVLLLVSQRSSEELLKRDGKDKLATDITAEVAKALGHEAAEPKKAAKAAADDEVSQRKSAKAATPSPVRGVLFSSFIIQ